MTSNGAIQRAPDGARTLDLEALDQAIIKGLRIFTQMAARLNLTSVESSLPELPNC
jgi:hypothetical protein